MPSASPFIGEMKHSSVGRFGLNSTPESVVSEPPQKRPCGIMPTVKSVTWYTEDPDIAKVDENGAVTGVAPGKTTVYALSDDGWFRASCEVTVNE